MARKKILARKKFWSIKFDPKTIGYCPKLQDPPPVGWYGHKKFGYSKLTLGLATIPLSKYGHFDTKNLKAGLLVRHNSKSEQPLKRLKIGAKSELLQGGSLKRLKIGAKSELLQGEGGKNTPFNIRKRQRTYEKIEFLAQTPLIITFYCISKL